MAVRAVYEPHDIRDIHGMLLSLLLLQLLYVCYYVCTYLILE